MPANKINYLVVYKGCSQPYGTSTKSIALSTPPPEGYTLKDKKILFLALEPDSDMLVWKKLPDEEVQSAEIVEKKKKDETT